MTTKIIQPAPIDLAFFVPRYLQIARHVAEQVRSDAFRPSDMVTDIFHPPFVGQTLTDQDYDELVQHKRLVSGIVEERCGIEVANINLHIGAEAADTGIAKMLDVDRGKPLLVIDREFVASDGTVVQIGRSRYATKAESSRIDWK